MGLPPTLKWANRFGKDPNMGSLCRPFPFYFRTARRMAGWGAILLVTLLFCAGCVAPLGEAEPQAPRARAGVMDLSAWDFASGSVPLDGTWAFYWGEFIPPEAFHSPDELGEPLLIDVPGSWERLTAEGEPLPPYGHGTYHLRVELGQRRGPLGLRLRGILSAFSLWVNGEHMITRGAVGTDQDSERSVGGETHVGLGSGLSTLDIVIHVSNFAFRDGGIISSPLLGDQATLTHDTQRALGIQVFLASSLFVIGLYHMGIWSIRRNDLHALFLGLFCLLLAARTTVMHHAPLTLLLPDLSLDVMLKVEYLGFYLGLPIFALFLWSLYPKEFSERIVGAILIVGVLFSLFVLFTPGRINSGVLAYFELFAIACFVYMTVATVRAARRGREGARLILLGAVIVFVVVIHDMLYFWHWIPTRDFAPVAIFGMVLAYSLIVSKRFSDAYERERMLVRQNTALLGTVQRQVEEIKRSRRLIYEREERTRSSIAETLHGTVQSRLLSARLYLQSALQRLEQAVAPIDGSRFADEASSMIVKANEEIDKGRQEVRDISHRLHPTLIRMGLVAAIRGLIERFDSHFAVALQLGSGFGADEQQDGDEAIDEKTGLLVYRTVEEALTNAAKHAQATQVEVALDFVDGKAVWARVSDNGRGMSVDRSGHGVGLHIIATRVEEVGGEYTLSSTPGQGTTLEVRIPVARFRDRQK